MKMIKNAFMLLAVVSVSILASCGGDGGGDGGPDETAKEIITNALTSGSWSIDVTGTDVQGVTGSPDASTFGITFSASTEGANYTLSGAVADYILGGSFAISEEGIISSEVANVANADLSATVSSISINPDNTRVTIVINVTEANARIGGIGTYTLVFVAG
ncbi:MAG: hypothetical protein JXR10_09450 [Cyclobacteriaceae bacterium]